LCAELLRGSETRVCTVAGFPLGATPPEVKAYETARVIADGACEVDMVINVGALKSRDYRLVERDIAGVAETCRRGGATSKVIIEAALLERRREGAGVRDRQGGRRRLREDVDGLRPGGATAADVALMRRVVGPRWASRRGRREGPQVRAGDDRGRRRPHRRQRGREDRAGEPRRRATAGRPFRLLIRRP
jgi:deoxyribose-phosphate aldolase